MAASLQQPLVSLTGVEFRYPSNGPARTVLRDISLAIYPGEIVRVRGRNGSGKTTLLRILSGDLTPTRGTRVVGPGRLHAVYLDQDASAFLGESLTLSEQLVAGFAAHLPAFAPVSHAVPHILELLSPYGIGLENRLNSFVGELSGGERQIIALLCALVGSPDLVLLDEFVASMDSSNLAAATRVVEDYVRRTDAGAVFVSHVPDHTINCRRAIDL